MQRFMCLTLLFVTIGCGDGKREERRRKDVDPPTPIDVVDPTHDPVTPAVGIAAAQKLQVQARANAMREMAAQVRSGQAKTVWDISDVFKKSDIGARAAFDTSFMTEMQREFKTDDDTLPANAATLLDKNAEQFESILK